jgi:Flp pilus assembly protein TadD
VSEAISHWQAAVQLQPNNVGAVNNLAWVLATCPIDPSRDGAQAVALAQRASQLSRDNPVILRTLAAAYARGGRFGEAVQTAQTALPLAAAQGLGSLSGNLEAELKLYQAGSPLGSAAQPKP